MRELLLLLLPATPFSLIPLEMPLLPAVFDLQDSLHVLQWGFLLFDIHLCIYDNNSTRRVSRCVRVFVHLCLCILRNRYSIYLSNCIFAYHFLLPIYVCMSARSGEARNCYRDLDKCKQIQLEFSSQKRRIFCIPCVLTHTHAHFFMEFI